MIVVGTICSVLLTITGVLCIFRIVRGPTMLDRTVATDVFVAASAGAIGVEAAIGRHNTTLSILVVLSLVGFLGSVSIARFAAPASDRAAHDDERPEEQENGPAEQAAAADEKDPKGAQA
jgi:multicomponent Na+:H+ antiporter subunit F